MRTDDRHYSTHAPSVALGVIVAAMSLAAGGFGSACGVEEDPCSAETRALAKVIATQRAALEKHGAVWIPEGVDVGSLGHRHLFFGSGLLEDCSARIEVAGYLEAVLAGAPDLEARRAAVQTGEEALAACVVRLWTVDSLWLDGLGSLKGRLLGDGVVRDRVDLVAHILRSEGLDASITWALIDSVPDAIVPAIAGRLACPRSDCERLWAAALLTNAGVRLSAKDLDFTAPAEIPAEAEARLRVVKSLLAGEGVTWDDLTGAGCWE